MPKKKQPRNAFFFFMLDFKARCERNGERFPNGLKDVQKEAAPEWDALPSSAKKKYEDMAKEEKIRIKGDLTKKETCWHHSFDSIEKQKQEEEDFKNRMNNYIETTISSLSSKKTLAEKFFYLIHVNYFCVSEGECFHPAEIAIVEFSLGEGVTDVYHTIIDPGPIPLGYRHDAMQKSESSHKIPVDSNGGKQIYDIIRGIKQFLERGRNANGGEYPPMYTMPDNVNLNTSMSAVKSVIETLCSNDPEGTERHEDYPIYSLEMLFFKLQQASSNCSDTRGDGNATNAFPAISFARSELEKDVFNYTPHIACEFHLREDSVEYCSKSYVQRWVYIICDHCCQDLNITMVKGRHLPLTADVNFRRPQPEEKKVAIQPKPFTIIDHSKRQPSASFAPPEKPSQSQARAPFDVSEDSFPSIPIGIGRGRNFQRGRGSAPVSFAEAMKNKK